jgi:hypothetical protein
LIVALQIGSSFCNTFQQFLACRSIFGIGMVRIVLCGFFFS